MNQLLRIVHYVNQFYGQIGGETAAGTGISIREEKGGLAEEIEAKIDRPAKVVATIVCGDDYFAENVEIALPEIMKIIKSYEPDVFFAGPAYAAGRYGMACAAICTEVKKELGIPAITAMNEINPGVDFGKKELFIVKTGTNARTMKTDLGEMARFAKIMLGGKKLGLPDEEGYFKRGWNRSIRTGIPTPDRTINMLLAKMKGDDFVSEIELPENADIQPAAAIKNLKDATIVLCTDGGLYPEGNPDNMPCSNPDVFHPYSIKDGPELVEGEWTVRHNGYDNSFVLADPNRLVPADAFIELEKENYIGKLHDKCLSTTGLITTVANSKKIGKAMVDYIKNHQIDAAILTST
ncbi:MAG TPA: glycine/betaine/sarcosine/D-proline family reductase selenoprotein B [Clostridiaceae bacterium]|nr:glycine/betaine/sarcosine/D-proline family reductase selenoprotein B [Clostridiaceae bacterium]